MSGGWFGSILHFRMEDGDGLKLDARRHAVDEDGINVVVSREEGKLLFFPRERLLTER